jgi:hypothetical protein
LLTWFRRVILQDAAVLAPLYPAAPIFQVAPFNNPVFRSFAHHSHEIIAKAEESARLALEDLPDKYAHTFRGLVRGTTMEQQQASAQCVAQLVTLTKAVEGVKVLLDMQMNAKKPRRRLQKSSTSS